jgi:hypothetical protein
MRSSLLSVFAWVAIRPEYLPAWVECQPKRAKNIPCREYVTLTLLVQVEWVREELVGAAAGDGGVGEEVVLQQGAGGFARGWRLDDAEDFELCDGELRNINPLRIRASVGRGQQQAIMFQQGEVVGGQAFEDVVVLEADADGDAGGAGAAGEGLAEEALGVLLAGGAEFADEADVLYFAQRQAENFAAGVENFEGAVVAEVAEIGISSKPVTAEPADNDGLLVGDHGPHDSRTRPSRPGKLCSCCSQRVYIVVSLPIVRLFQIGHKSFCAFDLPNFMPARLRMHA